MRATGRMPFQISEDSQRHSDLPMYLNRPKASLVTNPSSWFHTAWTSPSNYKFFSITTRVFPARHSEYMISGGFLMHFKS